MVSTNPSTTRVRGRKLAEPIRRGGRGRLHEQGQVGKPRVAIDFPYTEPRGSLELNGITQKNRIALIIDQARLRIGAPSVTMYAGHARFLGCRGGPTVPHTSPCSGEPVLDFTKMTNP